MKNKTEYAEELQRQLSELTDNTKKNLIQAYLKYKDYYDKKANANKLNVNDYCFILNPKLSDQSQKPAFSEYIWCGPYVVVKTLPKTTMLYED